ncbi:MAG TPA: hypothetical protein VGR74_12910 [Actinomycetota bacterium]|nr:hypothetical protein [Actinomycetota bacterium]
MFLTGQVLEAEPARRLRVTQQETFRGLLAPLLLAFIAGPTLEGFRQMNRALQARAEEPTSTQATP